jgi:hypothetical protein
MLVWVVHEHGVELLENLAEMSTPAGTRGSRRLLPIGLISAQRMGL